MTQEEIEKAADEFAEREYETNSIDRDYLSKGFFHGARWLADRLCSLPWDEAVKDLADYAGGKEAER